MADPVLATRGPRDPWVALGLSASALAALVSSFSGLRSLALLAGWLPIMAPLLPVCIDAYAATATRVWLAGSPGSRRARTFARANALGAIALSIVGNATDHLILAHLLTVNWVIVVVVGAVPPAVLGLVTHLAVLRKHVDHVVVLRAVPSTTARPENGTRYDGEAALLLAARSADAAYRAAHAGKQITRDELRKALRVSGARATAVLRALRSEPP
jgi:hypothetical protein